MASNVIYNNFTSGMVDDDCRRLVGTELYANSARKIENAVPLTTGGIKLREGLTAIINAEGYERIIPFSVSETKYYAVLIKPKKQGIPASIKIVSFSDAFTAVDDNNTFDVIDGWDSEELKNVIYTQDNRYLILCEENHQPVVIDSGEYNPNGPSRWICKPIELNRECNKTDKNSSEIIYFDYNGLFTEKGQFPSYCAFISGQLWMASTKSKPYMVWVSRPFDIFNFQDVEYYEEEDVKKASEDYLAAINENRTVITYHMAKDDAGTASEENANYKKESVTSTSASTSFTTLSTTWYIKKRHEAVEGVAVNYSWELESTDIEVINKGEIPMKWEEHITADCAMVLPLGTSRNSMVNWISTSSYIYMGTSSSESMADTSMTALNPSVRSVSEYGSMRYKQVANGNNNIYFIQSGGMSIMTVKYGYYGNEFNNITNICHSMFRDHGGIKRIVWQRVPEPRLYAILNDGNMAVLCDNGSGEVKAWCLWTFGDGNRIDDIAVIDTENGQDVYLMHTSKDGTKRIGILDGKVYYDFESYAIIADVVTNFIDSQSTVPNKKSSTEFYVDSLNTPFKIGQENTALGSPLSQYEGGKLVRVFSNTYPKDSFSINIRSVKGNPFRIIAIIASVEVY